MLTNGQIKELMRLRREPQSTFGSPRARVQNRLKDEGLAEIVDAAGLEVCRATTEGLRVLESIERQHPKLCQRLRVV